MGSDLPTVTLTFSQELTALCLTWFTASCSIVGSSCIVYIIYRQKRLNTFRRIMLGMSCCDVLNSFWLLWQGILLPRETSPRAFARGNDATCAMSGFFIQFGFSIAFYSGALSFYYLLTIRYGLTQRQIQEKYERYMHAVALLFPLATATVGVALGAFNETFAGPMCWVADYPAECVDNPDIPCKSFMLGYIFAGGPLGVIFVCIVINMFRIYRHVRRTLERTRGRSMNSAVHNARLQQVATQAYLFVLVFCLTFSFGFVVQSLEAGTAESEWNESAIFPYIVLNQIFFPLQGFFNFFIYSYPRVTLVRRDNPEAPFWWVLSETFSRDIQETDSTNRRRSRHGFNRQGTRSSDGLPDFGKKEIPPPPEQSSELTPANHQSTTNTTNKVVEETSPASESPPARS